MLSIGQATAAYYLNLAKDDYYHKGTEPAGIWYGRGAEVLGLNGTVNRQAFLALCAGYNPDEMTERLVQNAGRENRRAGWDLTFSAPKTVSALWATADEETRKRISAANYSAVLNALDFVQERYGFTRVGNEGTEVEKTDKLFFSLFEHSTSRAQDPQLHIHAVMVNVAINERGETRTLQTKELFRAQLLVGALYRAELAYQLRQELGVEIERGPKGTFEIKGDYKGLVEEWSKRREEIEKAMKENGAQGAKRAEHFTLKTREKKETIDRAELFVKWKEEARARGFNYESVLEQKAFQEKQGEKNLAAIFPSVVEDLTKDKAYFTEKDLLRRAAEFAPLCDATMRDALRVSARYLERGAIHLRTNGEQKIYTTPEIDALEKRMLENARRADERNFEALRKDEGYDGPLALSSEQLSALYHICESEGSLKLVSGMAGTGKTTLLAHANVIWKEKGFDVQGAALAGVAAKGLEDGAKIQSKTVARLLVDVERAEREGEPSPITAKTVLVVDEAGMVGTRQMARLLEVIEKEKAKLVLIGDEKQLQPIEHGAPFKAIGANVGRVQLKEIKRQKEEWAREAVHLVVDGESEKALATFAEKGLLEIKETRNEAITTLVSQWQTDRGDLKEKLILSTTRNGAKALNDLIQAQRRSAGEVKGEALSVNGYQFFAGDRIRFLKKNPAMGLENGQTGTVLTINHKAQTLGVVMDSGEKKIVPTATYNKIQLGYAMTTHRAQGQTVDRAYILAGGSMQDRELSYTQVSRAREATRIFTSVEEGGRSIEELAAKMNQSRMKALAQEQREEYRQEHRQEIEQGKDLSR